jgi:hypothetical protein
MYAVFEVLYDLGNLYQIDETPRQARYTLLV